MSRLDIITIAIVVICLAALGYLVYKIAGLYKTEEPTTSITEGYDNNEGTDEQTYTDWDDEVANAGDDVDLDDDQLGSYADTDEAPTTDGSSSYSDDELDSGTDIAEEPSSNNDSGSNAGSGGSGATEAATTNNYDNTTRSSNTGKYMVIAGSYRQRVNADNQASKLRGMGYNNTEVTLFDRGTFAVVLVDRFSSYGDAKRLVNELTGKGIDAVVSQ